MILAMAVKSVQRGVYSGAGGNVTISAVRMDKAVVHSASKGSAGNVQVIGTSTVQALTATQANSSLTGPFAGASSNGPSTNSSLIITNGAISVPQQVGTLATNATNLTVKVYSARLVDSEHIYCDGPCEWQVVDNF